MEYGELAVNYNTADVQLFIKDSDNNVVSVTALYAPLASPAFTGTVTGPTINASTALQIGGVAITSTAAELNILDGVTATAAELNILDGVTATAAELNILDGVTATNTELNYSSGVTSGIQNQIDAKAPKASPAFTGDATLAGDLTVNTDALFVDASAKNVGVGTASPGSYNGAADNLVIKDSADAGITICSGSSSDGGIYFNDTDDGNQRGIIRFDHGTDALAFHIPAGEAMRIDSSGNVGIGTTSPQAPFVVSNSGAQGIEMGYSGGTSTNFIQAYNRSSSAFIQLDVIGNPLVFKAGASAAEKMRIDSSGNLGIGTTAPVGSVYISGPNTSDFGVAANGAINLAAANGAVVGNRVNLNFACVPSATNAVATIALEYENQSNFGYGDIIFGTRSVNTDTAPTERLRIDSSGNVGIGTSSPSGLFAVHQADSSTSNYINITNDATGASSWGNGMLVGVNDAGEALCWQNESLCLKFGTSNTEKMRIDSSGRLLVGTTTAFGATASEILQVANSNGGKIALLRNDASIADDNEVGIITWYSADGNTQPVASIACVADGDHATDDKPGRLVFSTTADGASSPTEAMRIDSAGRLLIGWVSARTGFFNTTSITPYIQLETDGPSDDGRFMSIVSNPGASSGYMPALIFGKSRSTSAGGVTSVANGDELGAISFQGADGTQLVEAAQIKCMVDGTTGTDDIPGNIVFSTTADGASSPTERMRIDSSGTVGIGCTPSAWPSSDASQTALQVDTGVLWSYHDVQFDVGRNYYYDGTNYRYITAQEAERLVFYGGDHIFHSAAAGSADGVLTWSEKMRILSTGGITFNGDTATANALDDYEEGTFTPTLTDANGVAVVSPAFTTGNYVKIGNTVTVTYYSGALSISNSGNSSAYITNMPFTCWNSSGHYPVATFTHTTCFSTSAGSAATNIQNGFMSTNSSTLYVTNETSTSNAQWSTGGYLMFSITYRTA